MKDPKWSVSEAKAKFSDVVDAAQRDVQWITNRGKDVAVVMGIQEFLALRELQAQMAPAARMREFLRLSEEVRNDLDIDFDIPRSANRPPPFSEEDY